MQSEVTAPTDSAATPLLATAAGLTRRIYRLSGAAAVAMLGLIVVLTLLQIACRMLGLQVRGLSDIVAYASAGLTFLGLAYTFRTGGLLRVELVLNRLPAKWRHAAEIGCLLVAVAVLGTATAAAVQMVITSRDLGEAALFLPFPIWIAQVPLVLGLAILTLAFVEALIEQLARRAPQNVVTDTYEEV